MHKATFHLDQLKIEGESRAGDHTWFRVHPPGLAFDVGRGVLEQTGAERIFLTHGHLDHALGLPFVLSNRVMQALGTTLVYCPREIVGQVARFVEAAGKLEGTSYDYELVPLDPGDKVLVGRDLEVEAFAVDHHVPALGYHLVRSVASLDPEYQGRSAEELVGLRRKGVEISQTRREDWLSYCGDTGRAAFDLEPRLFGSRVLLLECTFLEDSAREKGNAFGHLHLEDLVDVADSFRNEAILLHHLTRRHRREELLQAVEARLPRIADRVHLMMATEA